MGAALAHPTPRLEKDWFCSCAATESRTHLQELMDISNMFLEYCVVSETQRQVTNTGGNIPTIGPEENFQFTEPFLSVENRTMFLVVASTGLEMNLKDVLKTMNGIPVSCSLIWIESPML